MARFACALNRFWVTRGYFSEARRSFEAVLAHADLSKERKAMIVPQMVEVLRFQGAYDRSCVLLQERLEFLRKAGEPLEVAETLSALGWTAFYLGAFEEARQYCYEGLALFQVAHNQAGIANCLSPLALTATVQGEYAQALELLHDIVALRREQGDLALLTYALNAQTRAAALGGQHMLAYQACREALTLALNLKQSFGMAYCLEAIAALAAAWRRTTHAVQFFSAANKLRTIIGVPLPPSLRVMRERELLALQVALGEESFDEHWEQGQKLVW